MFTERDIMLRFMLPCELDLIEIKDLDEMNVKKII